MKVFRIVMSHEEASDTRFYFTAENSAHSFFRWLSMVYGETFRIKLASEIETDGEAPVGSKESARRHMIWDHWGKYHGGPRVLH